MPHLLVPRWKSVFLSTLCTPPHWFNAGLSSHGNSQQKAIAYHVPEVVMNSVRRSPPLVAFIYIECFPVLRVKVLLSTSRVSES